MLHWYPTMFPLSCTGTPLCSLYHVVLVPPYVPFIMYLYPAMFPLSCCTGTPLCSLYHVLVPRYVTFIMLYWYPAMFPLSCCTGTPLCSVYHVLVPRYVTFIMLYWFPAIFPLSCCTCTPLCSLYRVVQVPRYVPFAVCILLFGRSNKFTVDCTVHGTYTAAYFRIPILYCATVSRSGFSYFMLLTTRFPTSPSI